MNCMQTVYSASGVLFDIGMFIIGFIGILQWERTLRCPSLPCRNCCRMALF
ncbi:hypothetical protein [Methanobrevibacter sp.]